MFANLTPLLAQVYREELGRGFRGATSQLHWTDVLPYVAAAVAAGVGWGVFAYVKRRNDMTERCSDPHKLFRELSQVHKLERNHRRLLLQLASALKFAQPAQVFVTPAAFEPSRLPAELRSRAAELTWLRQRLF